MPQAQPSALPSNDPGRRNVDLIDEAVNALSTSRCDLASGSVSALSLSTEAEFDGRLVWAGGSGSYGDTALPRSRRSLSRLLATAPREPLTRMVMAFLF